uniref:Uncharacterized protein n=1 Tax=Setaria digitata TaxID=48799 RepID=A0A915Q2Y4_9BILA
MSDGQAGLKQPSASSLTDVTPATHSLGCATVSQLRLPIYTSHPCLLLTSLQRITDSSSLTVYHCADPRTIHNAEVLFEKKYQEMSLDANFLRLVEVRQNDDQTSSLWTRGKLEPGLLIGVFDKVIFLGLNDAIFRIYFQTM